MAKVTAAGLLRSAEEALEAGRVSPEEANDIITESTNGRYQSVADLRNATAAPSPDPTEIVQKEEPQEDKSDVSFLQGAKDVATGIGQQFFGLGDEAYGLMQGIQASAPGGETFKEAYGRGRGESLERQKELSADPNAAYRLGQTGGFVGSMALPYAGIGKAVRGARALRGGASAAKIPQRLRPTVRGFGSRTGRSALRGSASGAASAGLYGAGSADTGERLEEGGKSALIGGLLGGAIGTAIPAVSAIKRTPGRAGERVNRLITEGMEGRRTGLISDITKDPKAYQKGIKSARDRGVSPGGQFTDVLEGAIDDMNVVQREAWEALETLPGARLPTKEIRKGIPATKGTPEIPATPGKPGPPVASNILDPQGNPVMKQGPDVGGTKAIPAVKGTPEVSPVRGQNSVNEIESSLKTLIGPDDPLYKAFLKTGQLNGKHTMELHQVLRTKLNENPQSRIAVQTAIDQLEASIIKGGNSKLLAALDKTKRHRIFEKAFTKSKWGSKGTPLKDIKSRIKKLQEEVDTSFKHESDSFRTAMKNQVEEATVQGYMTDIQRTLGQTDDAASALKNLFSGDATRESLERLWNRAGNQMPFDDFMTQLMKESDANKIYEMVNLRLLLPVGLAGGGAMGYARFMS